mgnify:CR=1 FL=1
MIQYFKNIESQTIEISKPEDGIWVNLVPPFKEEEFIDGEEVITRTMVYVKDTSTFIQHIITE